MWEVDIGGGRVRRVFPTNMEVPVERPEPQVQAVQPLGREGREATPIVRGRDRARGRTTTRPEPSVGKGQDRGKGKGIAPKQVDMVTRLKPVLNSEEQIRYWPCKVNGRLIGNEAYHLHDLAEIPPQIG